MNAARHGKWNLMQKKLPCIRNGKGAMRPSWMYKLGQNVVSIEKEQDNLSPE